MLAADESCHLLLLTSLDWQNAQNANFGFASLLQKKNTRAIRGTIVRSTDSENLWFAKPRGNKGVQQIVPQKLSILLRFNLFFNDIKKVHNVLYIDYSLSLSLSIYLGRKIWLSSCNTWGIYLLANPELSQLLYISHHHHTQDFIDSQPWQKSKEGMETWEL